MTTFRVLQVSFFIGRIIAKVLIEVGKRVEASTPEGDGTTAENGAGRVAQLRHGLSILRYMAREYARHLDKENRAEIKQHLAELNRIIRDIDRRAKAR